MLTPRANVNTRSALRLAIQCAFAPVGVREPDPTGQAISLELTLTGRQLC